MESAYLLLIALHVACICEIVSSLNDIGLRQCEPIRIDMCKNLGYNETAMPNLAGNEIQSDAEYTLQTFSPLIEYVCSSQLKLFLCATYVPMCTPKVPVPIGPCRSLCENVRRRCDPVLQGFGFPWPPALDCSVFPKENNQETMCMEGPGEAQKTPINETLSGQSGSKEPSLQNVMTTSLTFECPGLSKYYVKLHHSWRCAPRCEADILFGPNEKHVAEIWVNTWTYVALGLSLLALICHFKSDLEATKNREALRVVILMPLLWCHTMVVIGWTVRFVAGRIATSCGYDPQLPNISLLLVDGLSNGPCAATFILRYYFGMAASVWWSILCLGWHREIRRNSPDMFGQFLMGGTQFSTGNTPGAGVTRPRAGMSKIEKSITTSNLARFLAWGLPAFQTAAVIVARLVDADELLGSCFVGNQSDKGLQIFVATPLFCYWIFGSMNLASGFLVHRRNREILRNTNISSTRAALQTTRHISGIFLFFYCLPFSTLLIAVIYEFANIDVWLIRFSPTSGSETPMWPFLSRTLIEQMLAIICSAYILGPKITSMYKSQMTKTAVKTHAVRIQGQSLNPGASCSNSSYRTSNKTTSLVSYQSVGHPRNKQNHVKHQTSCAIKQKNTFSYAASLNKSAVICPTHKYANTFSTNGAKSFHHYGDETIL